MPVVYDFFCTKDPVKVLYSIPTGNDNFIAERLQSPPKLASLPVPFFVCVSTAVRASLLATTSARRVQGICLWPYLSTGFMECEELPKRSCNAEVNGCIPALQFYGQRVGVSALELRCTENKLRLRSLCLASSRQYQIESVVTLNCPAVLLCSLNIFLVFLTNS